MCGIAGAFGQMPPADAVQRVERMTQELHRRGPDSAGVEALPGAVLGHRRLAIFDLSAAGHQPMLTEDRAVGVVFNGAIYNFPDLRDELVGRGHRFLSATDTEVLLAGYREWGIDGLVQRLRGMFAFGLWDATTARGFLVRDRLGIKPLAYTVQHGELTFASTPRALRAGGVARELSDRAVTEMLEYGYVTDDACIYEGVAKLPAASIGEWRDGELRVRRYWSPPAASSSPPLSFEQAVERTESLLLQAVRARLHADVPVGALLSGGIDSGLVCWAIRELGGDITAYTVGAPGSSVDESDDAAATARELGIRHEILPLSDADPVDLSDLITAYAEPFAVESAFGLLRVSEVIRRSAVKVLLTGDGGDDVFLGYPRHRQLMLVQRLARRTPSLATPLWRSLRRGVPRVGVLRRAVHLADYVTGGLPAYLDAHDGLPYFERHGILGERLQGASVVQRGRPWNVASARCILDEYLTHDLHHQFVGEYITKVDGATMHHALEARSPFFDHELWEFASSLPFETRMHGGELKAILRELARRRIGPRVATLRKRGFAVPVQHWIAGGWRQAVEESFRDSTLAREGWIRADQALAALHAVPAGRPVPHQLWYLFVLEQWLRHERRGQEGSSSGAHSAGGLAAAH